MHNMYIINISFAEIPNYVSEYLEFRIFNRPNFMIPNFEPSEIYESEFSLIQIFLFRIFHYPNIFIPNFALFDYFYSYILFIYKLNFMYFYENFRQELLSKTLNFEQTCDLQRSKKTFRNYFLVHNSKYMYFYGYFRLELFCRKLNLERTCHHQGLKRSFEFSFW